MATPTPIVFVPGFWLGAWAWDEVVAALREAGCEATAITLPGLESVEADRSAVSLEDHVEAICEAARAAGTQVVLAVHSGAGFPGYAASDRVPDQIAAMVYVDTGPGVGAMDAGFEGVELPLPPAEQLAEEENLDGLSEEQLETFRARAVPQPGNVLRDAAQLTNEARRDVPSIVICTGFPSDEYKKGVEQGWAFLAGLAELRDVTWIDLPTSHWPMWSRPRELSAILADIARTAGAAA
jgi:pimeloyl-ACP methyl ester carboxylesterase